MLFFALKQNFYEANMVVLYDLQHSEAPLELNTLWGEISKCISRPFPKYMLALNLPNILFLTVSF